MTDKPVKNKEVQSARSQRNEADKQQALKSEHPESLSAMLHRTSEEHRISTLRQLIIRIRQDVMEAAHQIQDDLAAKDKEKEKAYIKRHLEIEEKVKKRFEEDGEEYNKKNSEIFQSRYTSSDPEFNWVNDFIRWAKLGSYLPFRRLGAFIRTELTSVEADFIHNIRVISLKTGKSVDSLIEPLLKELNSSTKDLPLVANDSDLSPFPLEKAPLLWKDRDKSLGEQPHEFIQSTYFDASYTLDRGTLRKLDRTLLLSLERQERDPEKAPPSEFLEKFPRKRDAVDAEVARAKETGERPTSYSERMRLEQAARRRGTTLSKE